MRVILDAGPVLNFLAVGQENCLIQLAATFKTELKIPDQVCAEVRRVGSSGRFRRSGAAHRLEVLLTAGRVGLLSDDVSTNSVLAHELSLVSGAPAADRIRTSKDLGELMVIAHACSLAKEGVTAYIVIDDGNGRRLAKAAQKRVEAAGYPGALALLSTRGILEQAEPSWLKGSVDWRDVYARMRAFDDGLGPLPA